MGDGLVIKHRRVCPAQTRPLDGKPRPSRRGGGGQKTYGSNTTTIADASVRNLPSPANLPPIKDHTVFLWWPLSAIEYAVLGNGLRMWRKRAAFAELVVTLLRVAAQEDTVGAGVAIEQRSVYCLRAG